MDKTKSLDIVIQFSKTPAYDEQDIGCQNRVHDVPV